jgi:hypothetical protein
VPVRAAISLCLALAFSAPARAADPAAQARELFQKGVQALAGGRSQDAVDAFEGAYKSSHSPSMLFYLGEAHRQAGNGSKALEEYQAYVEKLPAGPKRAEADARIGELKKSAAATPAPAPAAAPAKRKMALDDMDLGAPAKAKEPAKAAAKESAMPSKKLQLDDMELTNKPAAPAAVAETAKEKRRRARKSEEAAATQAAIAQVHAQPALAAPAPAKDTSPAPLAAKPSPAPTPAPAPPSLPASVAASQPAPAVAPSGLPRPTPIAKFEGPAIVPSQPTRPSEPIRESGPLSSEDLDLATAMSINPGASSAPAVARVPAPMPATPPAAELSPAPGALPRAPSRLAPSKSTGATTAGSAAAPARSTVPRDSDYATPEVATIAAPAAGRSDGSSQRAVGLIVGTVGVAALATGGLFGLGAKNAASDLNATAQAGGQYDPSVQSRGQSDQRLEIIFLAAGGAALATGALLYILAPASDTRASNADLEPLKPDTSPRLASAILAPVPGGVAAAARLSF